MHIFSQTIITEYIWKHLLRKILIHSVTLKTIKTERLLHLDHLYSLILPDNCLSLLTKDQIHE